MRYVLIVLATLALEALPLALAERAEHAALEAAKAACETDIECCTAYGDCDETVNGGAGYGQDQLTKV